MERSFTGFLIRERRERKKRRILHQRMISSPADDGEKVKVAKINSPAPALPRPMRAAHRPLPRWRRVKPGCRPVKSRIGQLVGKGRASRGARAKAPVPACKSLSPLWSWTEYREILRVCDQLDQKTEDTNITGAVIAWVLPGLVHAGKLDRRLQTDILDARTLHGVCVRLPADLSLPAANNRASPPRRRPLRCDS